MRFGFVDYDDNQYIYDNPVIAQGLTAGNLAWAFTTFACGNWHPFTWLSYMLDAQLFGVRPEGLHTTNVLLHAASAVLLFLALDRMTGRPWRSAVVSAIFALHPLHVESVAWISERKDVLSTFFEMAALWLYAWYTERRSARRYLALVAAFGLGLMAKPMLVTFPFLLLILDFWPLRRIGDRKAWLEKIPLVAMSAAASVVTFMAQRQGGAVMSLERMPLLSRLSNAAVAMLVYIRQAFFPYGLAPLYPVGKPDMLQTAGAAVILAVATAIALRLARSRPYLLTGWLWHVGLLIPVIGIVQVGEQAHADRYMYVPLIGISIAVVWLVGDTMTAQVKVAAGAAVLIACAILTWRQAGYWRDSRTLFERALAVTRSNPIMHNNLGAVLSRAGDTVGALEQYRAALVLKPDFGDARANLGHELLRKGELDLAFPEIVQAIRLKPSSPLPYADLAKLALARGRHTEALRYIDTALRLGTGSADIQSEACAVFLGTGRRDDAILHCREALRIKPDSTEARRRLAEAVAQR